MARTTFSGPVKSDNGFEGDVTGGVNASQGYVILYATAAANIADIANAVNTSDKQAGTLVLTRPTASLKLLREALLRLPG